MRLCERGFDQITWRLPAVMCFKLWGVIEVIIQDTNDDLGKLKGVNLPAGDTTE